MKLVFGNYLNWIFGSGTRLMKVEQLILIELVKNLPEQFANIVEKQIDHYVLVNREVDGRALNFYTKNPKKLPESFPLIETEKEELKLLSIEFKVEGFEKSFHANYHLVSGRFFCINFNTSLKPLKKVTSIKVIKVKQAWKSNLKIKST